MSATTSPTTPTEMSPAPRRSRRNGLAVTILIVIVASILAACGGTPTSAPAPPATPTPAAGPPSRLLDPGGFATAVADPRRVTINVHVPFEGTIDGTDASIPFDRITADSPGLPSDRSTPLALYCKTGPMSHIAATTLHRLGYRDIVELAGGMQAWQSTGHPLRDAPAG